MKLNEILEQVQWATGPNLKHAQPMAQRLQSPERDDYVLVEVDIERLWDQLDTGSKVDLSSEEGGGQSMRTRIPKAKSHWEGGGYMDPSSVVYNKYKDTFDVSDGRHRIVAAHQMGERIVPILIPDYQLEVFKEKLGAREI